MNYSGMPQWKNIYVLLTMFLCNCRGGNVSHNVTYHDAVLASDLHQLFPSSTKDSISDNSEISILTWNIQELGKSKSDEVLVKIASIVRKYDLVAIQEVVAKDPGGAQAVAKLEAILDRSGTNWDCAISDPTSSGSPYKSERYAYLWRTSSLLRSGEAMLDTALRKVCVREPYLAKFRLKSGAAFYVVNFHSRSYREHPEEEIVYFQHYAKRFKSNRVIIAGDFNLDENHCVWDATYDLGFEPAILNSLTTLKQTCKRGDYLSKAIDNIYFNKHGFEKLEGRAIDFVMDCDQINYSKQLSDHLPVMFRFRLN